jgi:two-component system sensor histidine kinase TctE
MSDRIAGSIRRDVLAGAAVFPGMLGISLFLFVRNFAAAAADEAFDRVLAAAALSIADSVRFEDGRLTLELPQAALAILGAARETKAFYAVRAPDGSLITGYGDLPDGGTGPADRSPRFFDARYRDGNVRVGLVGRYIDFGDRSGWVTVTVAETREARTHLSAVILQNSFLPIMLAGLVACVLIAVGINKALSPLIALEAELTQRAPSDLAPIRASVPREVAALVASLNAFMRRLDNVLLTLRGLVAEATHEVRTPLASIRAQAEVALSESDPAVLRGYVGRILANAVDATRVVNQLLAEAAVAHHAERSAESRCDLLELCLQATERLPEHDMQRCRLAEIKPPEAEFQVFGDRVAFQELVGNLLDNALKYAPGSTVDVSLRELPDASGIELEVADRGPGIPDDEKLRVMERFQRGSRTGAVAGSGLGLSIVRSVVTAANGTLSLRDREGGGLAVQVVLPRAR